MKSVAKKAVFPMSPVGATDLFFYQHNRYIFKKTRLIYDQPHFLNLKFFKMANTLTFLNIHYVFSTKKRQPYIDDAVKNRLWSYMGGIARKNNMIPQAIGGTNNHAHVLLSIPPSISPSKAIQLIKAGSSKWVHDEFPDKKSFSWQTGYAAYSVSLGKLSHTINYIHDQEEHHRKKTFEKEYLEFLSVNGIDFDEKYVWG
jgi:REP element-mobilizing transposase RayT